MTLVKRPNNLCKITGVLICLLIVFTSATMVLAKERYVLGGTEHPWESATSKETIDTISLLEGLKTSQKTKLIDMKSKPGFIKGFEADTSFNLAPGLIERGGLVYGGSAYLALHTIDPQLLWMVDGKRDTWFQSVPGINRPAAAAPYWFDLATPFAITKLRFYPSIAKEGPDPSLFPEGYTFSRYFIRGCTVSINDGTAEKKDPYGYPVYTLVKDISENSNPVIEVNFNPPQLVQFIQLSTKVQYITWQVAEMEVFGKGFIPVATYISNIIDIGEPASWGMIKWDRIASNVTTGAKVLIQTRTGIQGDGNIYFQKTGTGEDESQFTEDGKLIDKSMYTTLAVAQRGHVAYDFDNWSPWSAPYPFEEGSAPITSPGPRRFIQIRVDFVNTPDYGEGLKTIEFEYSKPPSATTLLAEVEPTEVKPAVNTIFTYAVKPTIIGTDTGFDSMEILTALPMRPEQVKSVTVSNVKIDLTQFPPEVSKDTPGIIIRFPKMTGSDNGKIIKVEFETMVLRYGTAFNASIFDSKKDEVKQRVVAGDATPELTSNDIAVRTVLGGSLIASVKASSKTITPNGDGKNDNLEISFKLLQLTSPVPTSLKIFDLSGILFRTITIAGKKGIASGQYVFTWDGKDNKGNLVPPGLYVYQIAVDSDSGLSSKVGTVTVAY